MGSLKPFHSQAVVATSIALTNAGDGLSKAVQTDPIELNIGDRVYLVIEADVSKVAFTPISPLSGELQRIHTLRAGTATIVDAVHVEELLEEQRVKNLRLAELRSGQSPLSEDVGNT